MSTLPVKEVIAEACAAEPAGVSFIASGPVGALAALVAAQAGHDSLFEYAQTERPLQSRYPTPLQASRRRTVVIAVGLCLCVSSAANSQPAFDAKQLASYRLTLPVFLRFAHATRLLAAQMRADSRFERDPLFSRDVSVSGDAAQMATAVRSRLANDATLASALFAADIGADEYVTFALALFGARLAHGFLESGAMRMVPPGVATDNVAFVREHLPAIRIALNQLGLE